MCKRGLRLFGILYSLCAPFGTIYLTLRQCFDKCRDVSIKSGERERGTSSSPATPDLKSCTSHVKGYGSILEL